MSEVYHGMAPDKAAAVMAVIAVVECSRKAGFSLESTLSCIAAFWGDADGTEPTTAPETEHR